MKINAKHLLSLLLVVLLLAALPCATAFAASVNLTVGQPCDMVIEQRAESGYITGVSIAGGSCPGLTLEINSDGTAAYLRGTPTTAGDYTLAVNVTHASGDPFTTELSIHVAEAPAPTPTPTPTPAPTETPEVPVEPTATPAQEVVVEDPSDVELKITKDPTGETKVEGGSAVFIARADGATETVWLLVSADGKTTYPCADAPTHFPGLQVTGLGTERLVLSNLPLSINGWSVQAMFNGKGGPLYSKKALLTVNRAQLNAPVISAQPQSVNAGSGAATLRVTASASEGELRYQWYKSSSNRNSGGQAIVGATGSSYTPAQGEGTQYYYVTVWAVSGDRSSSSVTSSVATVTFAAPTPTPAPTPQPTPAPAEGNPASDEAPAVEAEETTAPAEVPAETPAPEAPARRSGSPALIIAAILLLIGAAASVGVYIFLRRRDAAEEDDYDE